MQSSPGSPGATSRSGSLTSTNLNSIPGRGTPHEPGFTGPCGGVKVPVGEVSDMPQPSQRRQPDNFWNLSWTDKGSGAPPDEQYRSEDRSIVSTPGRLISATCIVGTPE